MDPQESILHHLLPRLGCHTYNCRVPVPLHLQRDHVGEGVGRYATNREQ